MKLALVLIFVLAATAWPQNKNPNSGIGRVCVAGTSDPNYQCPEYHITTIDGVAITSSSPTPEWVPDPSAGHYDCPDGYSAYVRSELSKYSERFGSINAVLITPELDKKGHALRGRPEPPKCIQDQQR